ncbi:sensor histidine kinase [Solicola gregarius]|uniref:Histidine kinase n=1 Tax=Solicola gregarius TaxID=2908642 RepID=A0AA46YMI8_9ACTN|nr:histidine kinase [Solicola gregarius]UYM07827.1 histidine kinase [Solicola gregarius]
MDECRRGPNLRWATRGQPLVGIAIWSPIVLLGAAQHAYESDAGLATWAGLVTIAAANIAALVAGMRRRRATVLFLVQAAATIAVTVGDASDWYTLYCLQAIAASAALAARWVPVAVLATTAAWAAVDSYADSPWSELWVTTLCLALAGFGTFVFCQLFATIAELNATRDALARTAVSAERDRFSRDLHDVLGHTLSLMVVKAQAVRRLLPDQAEAAAEHAADIESIGRQALDDVRETVRGYRETTFETEVARARDALHTSEIELAVDATGLPVATGQDALLGWAVREATTNVLRHSDGNRCTVELRRVSDRIELRIGDNGTSAAASTNGGSGLAGLHDRFAEAGGDLAASPGPNGFTVSATLPATTRMHA